MTNKILTLFLLAVFSGTFSNGARAQVVDQSAPIIFFETPQVLHRPFLDYIINAKSTIVMEMYHLDDPEIVTALINAAQGKNIAKKKIKISIILDGASFKTNPALGVVENQLRAAGIMTTHSAMLPGGFSITHVKAMVVDRTFAFITSVNLTTEAATTRDYGIISKDQHVIDELLAIFAVDIKNALADTHETPLPLLKLKNLTWSPVDSQGKLARLILESINIPESSDPSHNNRYVFSTVENLGDCAIQAALKQAAAAGVDVRIIVPGCDLNPCPLWNFRYLDDLSSNGGKPGVKTRFMPRPPVPNPMQPYMHGKMIVVGNGTAYLGSVNFSDNSMLRARELGIIVQTGMYPNVGQVLQGLVTSFKTDWDNSLDSHIRPTNCPAPALGVNCLEPTVPVCTPTALPSNSLID